MRKVILKQISLEEERKRTSMELLYRSNGGLTLVKITNVNELDVDKFIDHVCKEQQIYRSRVNFLMNAYCRGRENLNILKFVVLCINEIMCMDQTNMLSMLKRRHPYDLKPFITLERFGKTRRTADGERQSFAIFKIDKRHIKGTEYEFMRHIVNKYRGIQNEMLGPAIKVDPEKETYEDRKRLNQYLRSDDSDNNKVWGDFSNDKDLVSGTPFQMYLYSFYDKVNISEDFSLEFTTDELKQWEVSTSNILRFLFRDGEIFVYIANNGVLPIWDYIDHSFPQIVAEKLLKYDYHKIHASIFFVNRRRYYDHILCVYGFSQICEGFAPNLMSITPINERRHHTDKESDYMELEDDTPMIF